MLKIDKPAGLECVKLRLMPGVSSMWGLVGVGVSVAVGVFVDGRIERQTLRASSPPYRAIETRSALKHWRTE